MRGTMRSFLACGLAAAVAVLSTCDIDPIPLRNVIDSLTIERDWVVVATLTATAPQAGQAFGWSVDVSSRFAVVGAPYESSYLGAVYVYDRDAGWSGKQLTAADGVAGDGFGYKVKLFEGGGRTLLAVSAPLRNSQEGAVYIYEYDPAAGTWQAPAALSDGRLPAPAEATVFMGWALEVTQDYVFCGERDDGTPAGKVHIYSTQTFARVQTVNQGTASGYRFGVAISADDAFLFVGASGSSQTAVQSGAVYMYKKTTGSPPWSFLRAFQNPSPQVDQFFGTSLGLNGDKVAVGEPGNASGDPHRVLQFAITGDQIAYDSTIDSSATGAEAFGETLGFDGDWIVVGDQLHDGASADQGAAYLYGPEDESPVLDDPPAADNYLGCAVAVKDDPTAVGDERMIIGAYGAGASDAGKAFVLEFVITEK